MREDIRPKQSITVSSKTYVSPSDKAQQTNYSGEGQAAEHAGGGGQDKGRHCPPDAFGFLVNRYQSRRARPVRQGKQDGIGGGEPGPAVGGQ